MQPAEELRVVVFIGILAAVYVLAAGTIVRRIRQSMGVPLPPLPPWSLRVRRLALGLAAAGIPCFAYGWLVEPYWPEVVHVRIDVPGLPAGTAPIRIAQIGDIHSDPTERLEGRLPDIVAREQPDLIVFTGTPSTRGKVCRSSVVVSRGLQRSRRPMPFGGTGTPGTSAMSISSAGPERESSRQKRSP